MLGLIWIFAIQVEKSNDKYIIFLIINVNI